jgi:dTDP-4-dehydrorhamnose reductase
MTAGSPLQLWGGPECTVARLRDTYRDQVRETGHHDRDGDIDAIASLGIKTLRYPVVWERTAPSAPGEYDWLWTDRRLQRIAEAGMTPIAGLVHHGSGPRYTSLVDPAFPSLLAEYAEAVARRYPWMESYTPVNEPLTTARFSGLYGHWFPHGRDFSTFLRCLVTQCLGVVAAMRAIRKVNRHAKLVQTEDLGKVWSTPRLTYQADFENERRWLSLDLLCGRVDESHPWYAILVSHGIPARDLDTFRDGDGAPDIIGINYYATSERFLDERRGQYSPRFYSGNHIAPSGAERFDSYADVEALRVDPNGLDLGLAARLEEAWTRYGRPLAVTEAHHGSTRDEQVRWLCETWDDALALRERGVDVRAVTVWALFGVTDWNSLLTRKRKFYEPGAFDMRSGKPRMTAIGKAAQALAEQGDHHHPVLDEPGWWKRDIRFYRKLNIARGPVPAAGRRLLIAGANGTLGHAFARICQFRGLNHIALSRADMDITNQASVERALIRHQPWAIINTAGFVRVADAARERDACFRANAEGAETVATAAQRWGFPLVSFSSDLVFDGLAGRPYVEGDATCPACTYGESKAEAEARIAAVCPGALIIRTSAFFGPWDTSNFAYHTLRAAAGGEPVTASEDIVSPTYVPDLVNAVLDLLIDGERGIWHVANAGSVSWADFARRLLRKARLENDPVTSAPQDRLRNTALGTERGMVLPPLGDAVHRFIRECEVDWRNVVQRVAS